MNMKYIFVRLLLFFYLTSTYLGAIHIHHDALESDNCKVHTLVKNLNSGDMFSGPIDLLDCVGCFESIVFNYDYFIKTIIKGFDAHAPPLFS